MMKNVFILVVALLMGNLTAAVANVNDVCGDVIYVIDDGLDNDSVFATDIAYYRILSEENKTVELFMLLYPQGASLSIPQAVTNNDVDYTVISIADNAAYDLGSVVAVTLPPTIKRIGRNAFGFCGNLKTVTLPEGLEELGDYAFANSSIEQVNIPASLKHIGVSAFKSNCLKSITVAGGNPGGPGRLPFHAAPYPLHRIPLRGPGCRLSDCAPHPGGKYALPRVRVRQTFLLVPPVPPSSEGGGAS